MALELIARLTNELLADALMVVDLSIHNSMDGVVSVVDWLTAVRAQILYGKAAMPEC